MKQNYFPKVDIKGRVRVCLETLAPLDLKGKYVIDIGSSIGWLEKELLKYTPLKLVGVEPDPEAVAHSQRKVRKATFIEAPASKIPISGNTADIVVMFDVLEHVPKKKEILALREANRLLKRGGKLVLSTPNSSFLTNILDFAWYFGHRHYKKEYLKNLLKKAGFRIDKFEVRGGIWFSIYLIWHYFMKWILKKPLARNKFLMDKDDKQFSEKKGIHTIFLVAAKL